MLRSLEGLSGAEAVELQGLLEANPGQDPAQFDAVVARLDAVVLAHEQQSDRQLPARLAHKVVGHIQAIAGAGVTVLAPPEKTRPASRPGGWWAAAAALLLAVGGWWGTLSSSTDPNAASDVQALVDNDARSTTWAWEPTDQLAGESVGGEVRWSQALNTGYMRFVNLPANDPTVEQYQLWIFDETRDQRHPVDGGVFNVNAQGEAIIAMNPRLKIRQPRLFAVTVEPPGGVVVSDRDRLVLVANVP